MLLILVTIKFVGKFNVIHQILTTIYDSVLNNKLTIP